MTKKPIWIINATNTGNVAEVYLYGYIGFDDKLNTAEFVRQMRELYRLYDKIKIYINSGGGSVYDGMAFLTVINECADKIELYVEGIAASMAFIIVMAVPKEQCFISKYGRVMSHKAQGGCFGNAEEMRACADEIESCQTQLVIMIAERTGLTIEEAATKYMTPTDRWINAEQAVSEGLFADIYNGTEIAAPENITELKALVALYDNTLINSLQKEETIYLI